MKKNIRNIGFIALVVLLLASLYLLFGRSDSVASSKNGVVDFPQIQKMGILTVVTDYSPVSYFVKGDTVAGFNHDLVQMFQEFTDVKIEIVLESSLSKSLEGLATGKYNIIARNIPITSELKNKVVFSNPITQNKQILIQRKQQYNDGIAPVRSHLDLAHKTLYVSKKSPAILRINNLSREIGDTINYVEDEVYGAEQLAIMVSQKEIDYAVSDENTAKLMASKQPELDVETSLGFTHFEAWAVSKYSPALLDSLNSWINKAKKSKNYNKMYDQYHQ